MEKILYVATTAKGRNRLDGETVKSRLIEDFLKEESQFEVISIDTDNWKKHSIKLFFVIICNYIKCDKIIISSANRGAYILLKFLRMIKTKKSIYYFVIGASLKKYIMEHKCDLECYKQAKIIYVETKEMHHELTKLGLNNLKVLNNFRKVKTFKNNYKENSKIKFVFFGRVIPEKGIEESIELINKLNLDGYHCTLDIYGQINCNYYQKLQNKFNKNIRYNGEIQPNGKSEYEILSKYDIFIFPTKFQTEGLPGSLIDAYVSGLAVLAAKWNSAHEYIDDNVNGKIFKFNDYNDMYKKAKEMIETKEYLKYKKNSIKKSKNFLYENVMNEVRKDLAGVNNEVL